HDDYGPVIIRSWISNAEVKTSAPPQGCRRQRQRPMERTAHPRTAANIAGSGREHLPSRRFLEIGLEEAARTLDFGQPVGITILGLLLFTSSARSRARRE